MATTNNWLLADELRVRADAMAAINNLALQLGHTLDFYQQKAQAATR